MSPDGAVPCCSRSCVVPSPLELLTFHRGRRDLPLGGRLLWRVALALPEGTLGWTAVAVSTLAHVAWLENVPAHPEPQRSPSAPAADGGRLGLVLRLSAKQG